MNLCGNPGWLLAAVAALGAVAAVGCARAAARTRAEAEAGAASESGAAWKAGLAKVCITPQSPVWMSGYSARTKPSEGVLQDLHARALALEDRSGERAVLVTADLIGLSASTAARLTGQLSRRHGMARDRVLLAFSHTHGGPMAALRRRPPPGRRIRPTSSRWGPFASLIPRMIVLRDRPVTRATAATSPRPRARASVPAHSRRVLSFKAGINVRYFMASICSFFMH